METNEEQQGEKCRLLGGEKLLFQSLSGSTNVDGNQRTKYHSVSSTNYNPSNSEVLEEDNPIHASQDDLSDSGHSLGDGSSYFDETEKKYDPRSLATFSGVFAPVTLSMCSTMLFLRMGYVAGNAGVYGSVLMILIAFTILVCTVLSLSAIATNGAVEGGGVYFMISRTLGSQPAFNILCVTLLYNFWRLLDFFIVAII